MATSELRQYIDELNLLSSKDEPSKRDVERIGALKSLIAAVSKNSIPASSGEQRTQTWLRNLYHNRMELRSDMQEGTETLSYTQGAEGGYFAPIEFYQTVIKGMAQFDPLMDENRVTLIDSGDARLRPIQIPGWDLSTFKAAKISEAAQQTGQTPPALASGVLTGYTYRATLPVSFELEEDAFMAIKPLIEMAYGIGFARGIGADLINGNGTSAPQGVLTGAANSTQTIASPTVITADDINNIYYSVNRYYRNAPKCAWVMSDTTHEAVDKAHDGNNRPLINIVDGQEMLKGKPILVSPTMPSGASQKSIVFGDLSHYVVRVSRLQIRRTINNSLRGAEYGEALYTGFMRADAVVFDPTGGSSPAIVYATQHS